MNAVNLKIFKNYSKSKNLQQNFSKNRIPLGFILVFNTLYNWIPTCNYDSAAAEQEWP